MKSKLFEQIKSNLSYQEIDELIDLLIEHNITSQGKPKWHDYYMRIAKLVSTRSIDPSTKHGCIIVDENNRVLSIGYNGPIKNIDDEIVPLTRPEKYYWFSHSEENAIMFCKSSIKGATVYITGRPCSRCTRMLIQKEVGTIIYGNTQSKCVDEQDIKASSTMIEQSKGINFISYEDLQCK